MADKYVKSIGHNDIFKDTKGFFIKGSDGKEVARTNSMEEIERIARGNNFSNGRQKAQQEIANKWPVLNADPSGTLIYTSSKGLRVFEKPHNDGGKFYLVVDKYGDKVNFGSLGNKESAIKRADRGL